MNTQPDPHQYTRDAWEAKAEVWDSRMGDEGNDFFKKRSQPSLKQKHTQTLLDHFVPPRGFQYHPLDGNAGRNLNENIPEGMSLAYAPSRICSQPPSWNQGDFCAER